MFFQLLDLTIPRDFRLLLVRELTEEAEKSQDHPNPRLVVTSVGAKMFCDSRVTITNTGL